MNPRGAPSPHAAWAWVRRFVRPQRRAIAAILALSALATAVALAPPYIVKLLIDSAILADRPALLWPLIGALLGLAAFGAALTAANQWLHTRTSGRVLFALREYLYAHLASLSPRTLARHREGDLLARLDGDVAEIQRFALDSVLALSTGALGLVATSALLISLSPTLSLVALLLLPLEWLFLRWVRPKLAARARALREGSSSLSSFFVETLPSLKAIQSLGTAGAESARLSRLHRFYLRDLLTSGLWNGAAGAGPRLLSAGAQAAVFGLGGLSVIRGELSLGSLMAFSAYLAQASRPVQTLFGVYTATARARVSLERVEALTRLEPEVRSPARPRHFPADRGGTLGEIVFDDVSFRHPGGPPLLRGVHCKIPAASRVRLAGSSGAGKSTWVDLLSRHYDPDGGVIRLDGFDLRELDLRELRRAVAVVGQGGVLFAGSVADNLRYGNPEVDAAALHQAAERAELAQLLRERLVLDEATSEIDVDAEAKILATIDELFADKTRVVIQHHTRGSEAWDLGLEVQDGTLAVSQGARGARRRTR
jgi:ATP-binding cassette subfamily B protein